VTTPQSRAPVSAASVIYLYGDVSAPVDPTADEVDGALVPLGYGDPQESDWQPASWTPGMTSTARILIGPGTGWALAPGNYRLSFRVHDNPEVPVLDAGIVPVV
jgi:hypothetical protein